jgi:excisionase family DNA binding protein
MSSNTEPFVPIEELAKHFTVSVSTVRTWVRQGLIPKHTYVKVGSTYRFSVSKVVEALTNAPEEVSTEIESGEPVNDVENVDKPVQLEQLELDFTNPDQDA